MPNIEIVEAAVKAANASPCSKSKRGAVIFFKDYPDIVATGYNHLPQGLCTGDDRCKKACSKTCLHAEQRAILNLFKSGYGAFNRFDMLHIKTVDGLPVEGGPPSCLECSKLILYSGLAGMWLLETGKGWVRYTTDEFHRVTLHNVQG